MFNPGNLFVCEDIGFPTLKAVFGLVINGYAKFLFKDPSSKI